VENWVGEAPLVEHPYGYGTPPGQLDLKATTGQELWQASKR
jgi:cytochrome c oxidase subunit 1